jgi:hypothetical protein
MIDEPEHPFAVRASKLELEELDQWLLDERKVAVRNWPWPFAGMNDTIRLLEAEYERRGVPLPEDRS